MGSGPQGAAGRAHESVTSRGGCGRRREPQNRLRRGLAAEQRGISQNTADSRNTGPRVLGLGKPPGLVSWEPREPHLALEEDSSGLSSRVCEHPRPWGQVPQRERASARRSQCCAGCVETQPPKTSPARKLGAQAPEQCAWGSQKGKQAQRGCKSRLQGLPPVGAAAGSSSRRAAPRPRTGLYPRRSRVAAPPPPGWGRGSWLPGNRVNRSPIAGAQLEAQTPESRKYGVWEERGRAGGRTWALGGISLYPLGTLPSRFPAPWAPFALPASGPAGDGRGFP